MTGQITTQEAEMRTLVFEDAQKRKDDAKFHTWRKRWEWLAWSSPSKGHETELPEFIEELQNVDSD